MQANTHLLMEVDPETLLRYDPGWYDDLVLEAAQVALRSGITTVFDTWGPLELLQRVGDRITPEKPRSRIYFGGNIIGNGGPWSSDFAGYGYFFGSSLTGEINRRWEYGVGANLTRMTRDEVSHAAGEYIATSGVDFLKYTSTVHPQTARPGDVAPGDRLPGLLAGNAACDRGRGTRCRPPTCAGVRADSRGAEDLDRRRRRLPATRQLMRKHDESEKIELTTRAYSALPPCSAPGSAGRWVSTRTSRISLVALPSSGCRLRSTTASHRLMRSARLQRTSPRRTAGAKSPERSRSGSVPTLLVLGANPLEDTKNYTDIIQVVKDGKIVDRLALPEHPILTKEEEEA
jgi:hypothetical protein